MSIKKNELFELTVFGLLSFFLYEVNFLLFVFLVPLQIVYLRKGLKAFSMLSVILAVLIIIAAYFKVAGIESAYTLQLVVMELIMPLSFIFALMLVNDRSLIPFCKRRIYRILISASFFALISLLAVYVLFNDSSFKVYFLEEIEKLLSQIRSTFGEFQDFEVNKMAMLFTIEGVKTSMLRQFIFFYFMILLFVIWLSDYIHSRHQRIEKSGLKGFNISDVFIWPFMISWAGIMLSAVYTKGIIIDYLFWNAGMILLILFSLQGMSILAFFIAKMKVKHASKKMLRLLVIILLLWPGVNLFFIIGFSLFGASEIWIKYRE